MKNCVNLILLHVFLFYSCVQASIKLSVFSPQNVTPSVNYTGLNLRQINESDLALFKLSMLKLRNAVTNYFDAEPDHIFLSENVPFGDLHQEYCWEPVTIVATPINATVRNISNEPVTLVTYDLDNNSTKTVKEKVTLEKDIENTIKTTWSENMDIAIRMKVKYNVNFIFYTNSGYAGFTATLDWGKSEEKIQKETVRASTSAEIELKPGQKAVAVLSAQRKTIRVQVEYEATLRGILGVSFKDPYKGHYYWGVPIDQILQDNELRNDVNTVSSIELGYYTSVESRVLDKPEIEVIAS